MIPHQNNKKDQGMPLVIPGKELFLLQGNQYLVYDKSSKKSEVVKTTDLQKEIDDLNVIITQDDLVTDPELLAWAQEFFPHSKRGQAVQKIKKLRDERQQILDEINGV